MDRLNRVRTVFGLNHERMVYIESPRIANQLQMAACPDKIGIRLEGDCNAADVARVSSVSRLGGMNYTWIISVKRVIAKYAETGSCSFSTGFFAEGTVLHAGISPDLRPKICQVVAPRYPPELQNFSRF